MTSERRQKLLHELLRLQGRVLVRIARSRQNLDEYKIEPTGDEAMKANCSCAAFTESRLMTTACSELRLIEDAIDRLSTNNPLEPYGVCVDCDREISVIRLMGSPFVTKCIKCAQAEEEMIIDPHGVY
jgi:RNA polymerase-binding transcription factor DksA